MRRVLEEYILERERATGYQHVYTPDLAKVELYQAVRPLGTLPRGHVPAHGSGKEQMVLRPMNCPHHILVYKTRCAVIATCRYVSPSSAPCTVTSVRAY